MKRLIALVLVGTGLSFIQPSTAQAQAIVNGVITVYVTIQVNTAIPSGDEVACELSVITADPSSSNTEDVVAVATLSSGSIYTCTLAIPYYWYLSTPGTDPVSMTYIVGIIPTTSTTGKDYVRYGTHSLPGLKAVPADGTHTNINAPTTRL
jgi:hypothetical protein